MNKKKVFISIIIIATFILIYLLFNSFIIKKKEKILEISNISMNCPSNILIAYSDNTYKFIKGISTYNKNTIIFSRKYEYNINKIRDSIKDYQSDNIHLFNYHITLDNNEYNIAIEEAKTINDFIDSLNHNLNWCS